MGVTKKAIYPKSSSQICKKESNFTFASSCFGKRTCFRKFSSSCTLYKETKTSCFHCSYEQKILSTSVLFIESNRRGVPYDGGSKAIIRNVLQVTPLCDYFTLKKKN